MCKILIDKDTMSPLPVKYAKIVVILTFFLFVECAAGSCHSYGHACWGAHGKRSENQEKNIPIKDFQTNNDAAGTRWFLSRLIQGPLDFRYFRGRDFDLPINQELFQRQLLNDVGYEPETLKSMDNNDNMQDLLNGDENQLYLDSPSARIRINPSKIKSALKIMDKRSAKQN